MALKLSKGKLITLGVLVLLVLFLLWAVEDWHQLWVISSAPDNIPIVAMLFLVPNGYPVTIDVAQASIGGAGTAMQKLSWLGSATLNYSGTSAMITMGLILLIVFVSALVPARLASKIAAPSIDRTWKVPEPKDDQILAVLPFTINKTAAEGALAYIADFFDAHKEGTIGKFSAGHVEAFRPDDTGSRGLRTDIWLTPFDLGVRQQLKLLIHPGEFADIYEVEVALNRISGDDSSWYRLNRTFLTELRKQFLQWRSLAPTRMMEYVEQSRELFQSR